MNFFHLRNASGAAAHIGLIRYYEQQKSGSLQKLERRSGVIDEDRLGG
jgi:hypothetical protein